MEQKVFIGIGSNIGNSPENCLTAIEKLAEDKRTKFLTKSSLYITSPVSRIKQNDFINCAACVMWDDSPFKLLSFLNTIEKTMGREKGIRNGPRLIDLDILLFGELILHTPSLQIPHPELHKRKFAVIPCVEIDPAIVHPVFKRQLKEFLADISDEQKVKVLEDDFN